jgi:Carboxypeptidase regulatory-like domain
MSGIFEIAARISTPWALAAFAIAGIIWFLLKRQGKVPAIAWACIASIVLLGLVPIIVQVGSLAVYRVRVNVIRSQGTPVEDAKVWSSMGGEAKKVAGGWEFDIPSATRPADGKLTVWASLEADFLKGHQEVRLDSDHNPVVTIQLAIDQSASVRGMVSDRSRRAIAGALVSVAGYGSEAVVTQASGSFVLPAHAARDQNVLVHAEAKGYAAATEWHPAGDAPVTIVLDRR